MPNAPRVPLAAAVDSGHGPQVVTTDLPTPDAVILVVDDEDGPRTVVVADPRVDAGVLARVVAAATVIADNAGEFAGEPVPVIPVQRVSPAAERARRIAGMPEQRSSLLARARSARVRELRPSWREIGTLATMAATGAAVFVARYSAPLPFA